MKVLFLGPYRQSDLNGFFSLNILRNISQKYSVCARPIYYIGGSNNPPKDICDLENNNMSEYEILIQNVRPKDCLLTNQFDKNIFIPILQSSDIDNDLFMNETLDSILVDEQYDTMDFIKINKNKIKIFDYSLFIKEDSTSVFDLGIWNKYTKLYTILDYYEDLHILYSIIRSFIKSNSIIPQEFCLVLFITNLSKQDSGLLQEYINNIYNTFKAAHTINKIVLVPIQANENNIVASHNSGTIFLDVVNNIKNKLNKKIATEKKKNIINIPDRMGEYLQYNNRLYTDFINTNTDHDICESIQKFLNNKATKTKQINKKHILELI